MLVFLFLVSLLVVLFILYKKNNKQSEVLPVSNKVEVIVQTKLRNGIYATQGRRSSMEDSHVVQENSKNSLYALFDGHGGKIASSFVSNQLANLIETRTDFAKNPENTIREAILEIEQKFLEKSDKEELLDGTTVLLALINNNDLIVVNVGDSECIICSNGVATPLSEIHNFKNVNEISRIQKLGGTICKERLGHPSLNPEYFNLGLTRTIGDAMYKLDKYLHGKSSGLISDPFIRRYPLDYYQDHFLILACDGLWDVFSYQEASDYALNQFLLTNDPTQVAKSLVEEALRIGSGDNITAMVITWKEFI